MRDSPRRHPMASEAEIEHIEEGSLAKSKEIPKTADRTSYLRNYRFWLITIVWASNNIFHWGWSTWMPTHFQTYRHFSFNNAAASIHWAFCSPWGRCCSRATSQTGSCGGRPSGASARSLPVS